MDDNEQSQEVDAPADELFEYLANVRTLPRHSSAMTRAEPAQGDTVHVTAVENSHSHDAAARCRVDRDHRHLDWGAEGVNAYHGRLDVTPRAMASPSLSPCTLHPAHQRRRRRRINQGLDDTGGRDRPPRPGRAAPGAADD